MKILIPILLGVSFSAFSTTYQNEINLAWFHENHEYISIAIDSGEFTPLVPIVNTIGEIWKKRDGGISGEVSPVIAKLLVKEPELMLSVFEANPEHFSRWLNELQSPLFTDFTGNEYESLVTLHHDLLGMMLKYSKDGNPRLVPFSRRLVEKLKVIDVRVVD